MMLDKTYMKLRNKNFPINWRTIQPYKVGYPPYGLNSILLTESNTSREYQRINNTKYRLRVMCDYKTGSLSL